jgi:hypothetical protein
MPARPRRSGHTLAEIIVSLALVSLLMLSIYEVLRVGTRYLTQTTLVTDLQQSCVVGATRLVGELLESNINSIRSAGANSVTFGSARTTDNSMTFETESGGAQLVWQSIVGYYIHQDGEEPALWRKEEALSDPPTTPPRIASSYDADYWIGSANLRRQVASRVYYVDVVSSTNVDVIMGVRSRDGLFQVRMKTKLKTRN